MTLAWSMLVEYDTIAIAISRENYSYELLSKSKEFTLMFYLNNKRKGNSNEFESLTYNCKL